MGGASPRSEPGAPELLDGWKAIAEYLGKSVRTAQRYHRQLSMPVYHRMGLENEGVYALRAELDAWQLLSPTTERTEEGTPAAPCPPPARIWPWSLPAWISVVLGLVSVAVVLGVWLLPTSPGGPIVGGDGQPAKYTVAFDQLQVFDKDSRLLWAHRFPAPLSEVSYRVAADPRRIEAGGGSNVPPRAHSMHSVQLGDIDGDGHVEVLMVARVEPERASLYCFSSEGRVRWIYRPRQELSFGGKNEGVPERVNWVVLKDEGSNPPSIWVESQHTSRFPALVEQVSVDGQSLGGYWSNGHVISASFGRVGPRDWLFLGGANNERGGGFLAAVDPRAPDTSAPAEAATYRCDGCPTSHPDHFIVFPSTRMCGVDGGMGAVSAVTVAQSGQIVVNVTHHSDRLPGGLAYTSADTIYTLSADFRLIDVDFHSDYAVMHRYFETLGRLTHPFVAETHRRQLLPVVRWDGRRFVEISRVHE